MDDDIEVVINKDYYKRYIYRVDDNKKIGTFIHISPHNIYLSFLYNKSGERHGISRQYDDNPPCYTSVPYLNGKMNGIGYSPIGFDRALKIYIYKDNRIIKAYGPYNKEDRIIPFNIG